MKRIVFGYDRDVGQWVCQRTGGTFSEGTAIGFAEGERLIAGVLYDNYNGASICMHVAGEGKRWMTREYLRICFDYPFNQLKVRKVIGLVPSSTPEVVAFDKNLGFIEEHRIRDAHPRGDLVILSMTKQQCRFLGERYGSQKLAAASA